MSQSPWPTSLDVMFRLLRDMIHLSVDCIAAFLDILRQEVTCYHQQLLLHVQHYFSTPDGVARNFRLLNQSFFLLLGLYILSQSSVIGILLQPVKKKLYALPCEFSVHLLSPSEMKLHAKQILIWPENCKSVPAL